VPASLPGHALIHFHWMFDRLGNGVVLRQENLGFRGKLPYFSQDAPHARGSLASYIFRLAKVEISL
jgi:hypothetical protein